MPTYDYVCSYCEQREQRLVLMRHRDEQRCDCGAHMTRVVSAPAIAFKGSGWYVTDYKRRKALGES
jgi:putative FmdB family regulatory protein